MNLVGMTVEDSSESAGPTRCYIHTSRGFLVVKENQNINAPIYIDGDPLGVEGTIAIMHMRKRTRQVTPQRFCFGPDLVNFMYKKQYCMSIKRVSI